MGTRRQIPLDYSSSVEEQKRDEQQRQERKEKLENYNEATFGERRPYAIGPVPLRILSYAILLLILNAIAPRPLNRFVPLGMAFAVFAYAVYEQWRR